MGLGLAIVIPIVGVSSPAKTPFGAKSAKLSKRVVAGVANVTIAWMNTLL